jgi:hypothetical protein
VETVDEVLENDIALDILGDADVGYIGDEVGYTSVEDEEGYASVDRSEEIDAVDGNEEVEILSNDILEIQHSVEDLAVNKSTLRMRSSRSSEVERELDLEDLLRIFQFGLDVGLSSGQGNDLLKMIIDLFAKYNANVKVNVTTWKAMRQIVLRGTENFEMKLPFKMALPELYFGTMDVDEPDVKLDTINGHFFNMKFLMANIFSDLEATQIVEKRNVRSDPDGDVLLEGFDTGDRFKRFSDHKVNIAEEDRAMYGDPIHIMLNISFDKAQVSMNNSMSVFPVVFNVLNVKGLESKFHLAGYCPTNLPYDDAVCAR